MKPRDPLDESWENTFEANGIIRPSLPRPIPIVFLPDQTLLANIFLTGGPSDLLTSSLAPFRRSGRVTHAGKIQTKSEIQKFLGNIEVR